MQARRSIVDPDARFFLGLLLNVPTRADCLRLVAERFPGEDPAARCAAWLAQMGDLEKPRRVFEDLVSQAGERGDRFSGRLAAALAGAPEPGLAEAVLRALVDGARTDEGVVARVRQRHPEIPDGYVDRLRSMGKRLLDLPELASLFR